MLGRRDDATRPRGQAGLRLGGLFLLLVVVCGPVVALSVDRNPALFVLDEFAYADYLYKIDGGRLVVRHGELSGERAMRALACRGYTPSTWNNRPRATPPASTLRCSPTPASTARTSTRRPTS